MRLRDVFSSVAVVLGWILRGAIVGVFLLLSRSER